MDDHASGTLYEYPLIVDVDNDGSTEIVLASNNYAYGGWNGITVIGDAADSWRPSRPIWNQYAYSITNVEDDGSIPARPAPNWERYNNFRTGGTTLGLGYELPDLSPGPPETCMLECGDNVVELVLPVANSGLAATAEFEVRIVRASGGTPLFAETVPGLEPGVVHELGPYRIERRGWSGSLFLRVDDDNAIEECDEGDNVVELGEWPCP